MSERPIAIRYGDQPVVPGPLHHFNRIRHRILADTMHDTQREIDRDDVEQLLAEALYLERRRLKRRNKHSLEHLLTIKRQMGDDRVWGWVRAQLLKKNSDADRKQILRQVLKHYSEEIGAHFSVRTYGFARRISPWMFSWLLNAASVKRFAPWGMTESLTDRLRITGEIDAMQDLAKRGTILLVPTHQSNIDSVLIGYVIYLMSLPPFSYGAGLNLFSNPVLSFFMSNLGAYTVDRQKTSRLYKSTLKNYSTRILQEGIHSIFFPGGGRSRTGAVESHVKLGLLGTGLKAEIANLKAQKAFPRVFIVPMVTSYHFVLEAGSLIESHLQESGRHLFMRNPQEEPPQLVKLIKFFWKFFSIQSNITVNFGQAMDVFGNPVDRDGHSRGPNGTIIDPKAWLTTNGELTAHPERDAEYTRQLGSRLVESYYKNNVVLDSHLVAFALFTAIRKRYRDLDLFRFVRLSEAQRTIPLPEFMEVLDDVLKSVKDLARKGELKLSPELQTSDLEAIVKGATEQLGVMHDVRVIRIGEGVVSTDDLSLLYYYRNRLSGYGLTLLAIRHGARIPRGEMDEKGFLA